ncbi:MAG: YbaB/EbfC family nucleoid-associated protein [Deltaproteobacteria bacterium]|nr:YbaB/EbfC family nucleoid-associated protein [Deltaproteobacteria bacterium]
MTDAGQPNLSQLLQTAQHLQQEMQRVQQELVHKRVDGSAGGGMVVATVNGQLRLVALRIEPELLKQEELDMLQDLVVAAVNQGIQKAQELAREELARVTGGMLPGLGGLQGLL